MLLTTLSAVAQQESENISEHVKLGLQMKMNKGELIGFNSCYGYNYNQESKKLFIVEKEAEVVKFIIEQYCAGHGANGIAKMLMKHGRFQLLHNDHMKYLLAGKESCELKFTNKNDNFRKKVEYMKVI